MIKDYYALLGIESNAARSQIKRNYRLLATKFHPDKNSDSDAASKFIAVTEAYDVLSNRKSRAQYDLKRWETLKELQRSDTAFKTIVLPREPLRARRNRVQEQRSIKYHQTESQIKKTLLLLLESLYIVGRYLLHFLGITLMIVILGSAVSQLGDTFDAGIGRGIAISALVVILIYGIFKTIHYVFVEFKNDIVAFANAYKLSQRKAALSSLSVLIFVLLLYGSILQAYK